ncbi:MAG: GGDEF domain-containing protein [Oscillospiraceae bacterium]|jgi:diguanylate cyclase (GGDEF)-like protein|nr:GGDEF domain-containing protein [Oscillospiraceae bacterium]
MDLFDKEQGIFDEATARVKEIEDGSPAQPGEYVFIVKEYGKLLKQLRRVTKMADRTAGNLNTSKLDLLDKVHYDALTGINNRRFLTESLRRNISSLSRHDGLLSILMIDVDFFKKYNDTYGHGMGDDCLKSVAAALAKSLMRADDFVARYGGEEFVIVLPNTDKGGAIIIAERILQNVRALNIPHEKSDAAPFVTISVGVTTGEVKPGDTGDDFIKRADEALYDSKHTGRNRYTYTDYRGDDI